MNKPSILLLMVSLTGCKLDAKLVETAMHSCDKNGGVDYFAIDGWDTQSKIFQRAQCNDGMSKKYPSEGVKP